LAFFDGGNRWKLYDCFASYIGIYCKNEIEIAFEIDYTGFRIKDGREIE